ncbi:VWA domain-containing protein, partial [Chloroflexota bacterium]
RELMGDDTVEGLEKLRDIPRILDEAGYICLRDNRCELTPRGMRKIGQSALEDIFVKLRKDGFGGHNVNLKGGVGDRMDETKMYEFGDDFQLHLPNTIMNSLYRELKTLPVKLSAEDFEVFKTEGLTTSANVLMLDLSFSMAARGRFQAAKRVAIALDGLIRSQYPRDKLYIVGFSSYARQIEKEDLAYITWDEFDIYTNIQHGLYIARKLLVKETCNNRQIILVSDGEPTAHVDSGNTFFHQAPPGPRTLELTLKEVRNCTKEGIVINTFMLENDRFLRAFVTQMARINKGRVFFTSADSLGQYLLVDYVSNKRRRL